MLFDYHTHTPLCHHAEGHPADFAAAARRAGLAGIGVSDHSPMRVAFDDWRMDRTDLPRYFEMVAAAREAHPGFDVRLGLEVDFLVGHEPWIEELAAAADWDYLIGGVHYITEDWDVDNPKWLGSGRWERQSIDEVWRLYFAAYERSLRSKLFDFHAHPDLVKKFGQRPEGDLRSFYDPVVQAAVDTSAVLELNTAGWSKQVAEQYPAQQFLALLAEARVPLVISSDAHQPSEVARDFGRALALVWEAGYRETPRFERRTRHSAPLPSPSAWAARAVDTPAEPASPASRR
jgi:histidinol-phosphatase (PHP family)